MASFVRAAQHAGPAGQGRGVVATWLAVVGRPLRLLRLRRATRASIQLHPIQLILSKDTAYSIKCGLRSIQRQRADKHHPHLAVFRVTDRGRPDEPT